MFIVPKGTNNKSKQITFRVTEQEFEFIEKMATRDGYTVANWVKFLIGKEYTSYNNKADTEPKKAIKTLSEDKASLNENIEEGKKKCKSCNKIKDCSDFQISKTDRTTGKIYYKSKCKSCMTLD